MPMDPAQRRLPLLRRISRSPRPSNNLLLWLVAIVVAAIAYQMLFRSGGVHSEVIDFSKSIEKIRELSTVKTHLRFGVVVHEESGNIIVRSLADQSEYIGMDNMSAMLFQDPTMIVELHGVATYGVRLDDLASRLQQDDSTVTIRLPDAGLLDVKLVAADTRIIAQMKGLFRSSNNTLLLEASRKGEDFTRDFAEKDTTLRDLALQRARDVLALIVQAGGKHPVFE